MLSAIGAIVPPALAIALSPFPIVAIILLLLSPKPRESGAAFCVGWIVGLLVPLVIAMAIAEAADIGGPESSPSRGAAIVRIVIGLALILLGVRRWLQRPKHGATAEEPKWLAHVDALTPVKALGLGLLLSAVNPKELLVTIAAALALAKTELSATALIVPSAVFIIVASLPVIAPLAAYLLVSDRIDPPLAKAKKWLIANDSVIMAVVLWLIGAAVLAKGLHAF